MGRVMGHTPHPPASKHQLLMPLSQLFSFSDELCQENVTISSNVSHIPAAKHLLTTSFKSVSIQRSSFTIHHKPRHLNNLVSQPCRSGRVFAPIRPMHTGSMREGKQARQRLGGAASDRKEGGA